MLEKDKLKIIVPVSPNDVINLVFIRTNELRSGTWRRVVYTDIFQNHRNPNLETISNLSYKLDHKDCIVLSYTIPGVDTQNDLRKYWLQISPDDMLVLQKLLQRMTNNHQMNVVYLIKLRLVSLYVYVRIEMHVNISKYFGAK